MYYLKQIHIQNFRNIEYQTIQFWKNKTVFVWKNGSWKTVILKAIDKLLNAKKIKEKDFRRKEKKIILEAIVSYNEQDLKIKIESYFEDNEIINKTNFDGELQKDFLEKTNVIYIPFGNKLFYDFFNWSTRKFFASTRNKNDWQYFTIDLRARKHKSLLCNTLSRTCFKLQKVNLWNW